MSITSPRRIIATSPSDITTIGIRVAKEQFMEVCKETERIMKEKAPHPINSVNASGRPGGKGSMATGKTKRSITIEKDGEYKAFIGPSTDYAYYAENGRDPISKPYKMRFRGADGRIHYARHGTGMVGWHFVEETADEIRSKYGV